MTVQAIIYPHNINAISSRQVRRIKENINICGGLLVDPILNSPNKLTSQEMYGTQLWKCPHKKKSPLQKKTSLSLFITYTSQSMYNPSDSQTHSSPCAHSPQESPVNHTQYQFPSDSKKNC